MRGRTGKFAGTCALVLVAASTAAADPIPIFDTGVDASGHVLAPGNADPHYVLLSAPAGYPAPAAATVAAADSAYVQNDAVGSVGSSWISAGSDTSASFEPGDYVYRTTFDLTGLDPSTAHLDCQFAVDDNIADIVVNGQSTGLNGAIFFALTNPFPLDGLFQDGVNTIDFVVENFGGAANPTGFRFVVSGHADPKVVPDHVPPVLAGVADHSFQWTGSAVALTASALGITAVDAVDGPVAVTLTPSSAGLGDTVVTASASDAAGNKSSAQFTVHVADTVAPTIVSLSSTQTLVGRGDRRAIQVVVTATATDAGDPSPTVTIASVTAVGGSCRGWQPSGSFTITGPLTVQFRADDSLFGRGRTYAIVVQATDASGNKSTATLNVVIGRDSSCDRDGRDDDGWDDGRDCGSRHDD